MRTVETHIFQCRFEGHGAVRSGVHHRPYCLARLSRCSALATHQEPLEVSSAKGR